MQKAVISVPLHHFLLLNTALQYTTELEHGSPSFTDGTGMREQYISGEGGAEKSLKKQNRCMQCMY